MEEKFLSVRSGVLIPLLQALVTGFVYGVGVSVVAWVMNLAGFDKVAWWKVGFASFLLAFARAWLYLLKEWRKYIYGEEQPEYPTILEPQTVKLELSSNDGRTMQFVDLPAERGQLIRLGQGIMEGASFTEAQWVGRGQPFTRTEFVRLRSELIKRGFLVWNSDLDPARGVRVTGKGKAIMRQFASMTDSPTLLDKYTLKSR